MGKQKLLNRSLLICIAGLILGVIMSSLIPVFAYAADGERKTVVVGWHEEPHYITDEKGRKSGYSYEYQMKVAAYTGWKYECVEGTWSDLFEMLKRGEIDIMSDVSYTEERAKDMLYTSLPMGTEAYYVFVTPDNKEIIPEDLSTLNGKRVGVTVGSIQREIFEGWLKAHGIEAQIVAVNCDEEEGLKKIGSDYDAFVSMDTYGSPDTAIPLCKVGSSDFYFAVNKNRPDLLAELDAALNNIQNEDKYYDQKLHDKYLKSTETDKYLGNTERAWLAEHGAIRVGYQDNYLAFCAKDKSDGGLTGALKDYLDYASSAFMNKHIDFETTAYPTASDAIEALKRGEIDCVFPANLTSYDAEMLDLVMSPPLMRTAMDAVVRGAVQKEFLQKQSVTVAVNEGNTNYDLFLEENYPGWERTYYKDTPTGLEAVADGSVDCVIISNYRYSNISKQCEKLHLTMVYTGVDMDYSFASRMGEPELYSVLSSITRVVPDAVVNTALTYYSTEDVKTSFRDLIKDNLFLIMAVIAAILMVILVLLLNSIRAERKILEEERLVKDLNKRVFIDPLTAVRNKGAFSDYIQSLQKSLDRKEINEFAVGIFDCNDLKKINDQYGHDKGDIYLKAASGLICSVFEHSPVFRIGGDEFAAFLLNDDYENRQKLLETFEKKSSEICRSAENKWDETHIAYGIACYDPGTDESADETVRRADKAMYENKRRMKEGHQSRVN